MAEILIIRDNIAKIKNYLEHEHIQYEVSVSHELSQNSIDKLKTYIETKSKEDIFADYGEAIKDKELETEKRLLEEMDDEEEWASE